MRKTIHRLLLAAMLFAVPSCIVDKKVDFPEGPEKGAFELVLRLKTPGGFSTPETRALTYAQENTITDIYVLVFYGGDDLVAIKRGKNVKDETENIASPTPNHYSGGGSFSVDLTEFDTGNRYQLVVLANAESILSSNGFIDLENVQFVSPYLGAGFDEVAAAISATLNTKYTATTIPMWGQTGLTHINPVVQLPAIEMRRALARIDVGMGAYDESDNSWDGMYHGNNLLPEDDREIPFRMTSVRIMRPNNAYTVIPDPDDVTAGLPSLAGTSHTVAGSEVFDYTDIVDGHYITRSIYVPEANVRVTGSGTYNDSDHEIAEFVYFSRFAVMVQAVFIRVEITTQTYVEFICDF